MHCLNPSHVSSSISLMQTSNLEITRKPVIFCRRNHTANHDRGASSGSNNDPKPEAPVELNLAANTYNDASAARAQHVTDVSEGCVYSQVNLDNKKTDDSVFKPDVEELYENALGPQVPPKLYPNDLEHVDGEIQLIENDLYSE